MRLTEYQQFWKPGVTRIRASASHAPEIWVYLHLAKTGGSSLSLAMSHSHSWSFVQFPEPHRGIQTRCRCGATDCAPGHIFDVMISASFEEELPGRGLFVNSSHVTYDLAKWLATSISSSGHRARMVTTVRPARRRAISYFRHYWEQVSNAEKPIEQVYPDIDRRADAARLKADLEFYRRDSHHYRDADGQIDGATWFRAQVLNAAGFPFLLRDVFGKPKALSRAVQSGKLLLIPTAEIDENLKRLGVEIPSRMRVSSPMSPRVRQAIEESASVLDEIELAEAPYDSVLRTQLGNERFPRGDGREGSVIHL